MHQPTATGSVHLNQPVIRHTPKRPSAADIARAWSQAQSDGLPGAVSDVAHDATAYERFARVYRELCARPRRARRRLQRIMGTTLAGAALMIVLGHVPSAEAATITVNENCAVGPTCSLIDAINAANSDSPVGGCPAGAGADTIVLACPAPANTYELTTADNTEPYSANGLPIITSPVTIAGNGATIARNTGAPTTAPYFRFFEVAASGDLTLNDTTLTNGYSADGGAIWTKEGGSLTLNRSTLTANRACYGQIRSGRASSLTITSSTIADNGLDCGKTGGGIIFFGDTMTLHNSTVSGNANGRAGGIYASGNIVISHSTITGNTATSYGGGLLIGYSNNGPSTVSITHSLIAGNAGYAGTAPTFARNGDDLHVKQGAGNVVSSYNLFGQDGLTTEKSVFGLTPDTTDVLATSDGTVPTALANILSPLADNGGRTPTHALPAGSPAVDAGIGQPCPLPTDQRGESRPQGSACDIGAFELVQVVTDSDGDSVPDEFDLCPGTDSTSAVDANGCSNAQVDRDGDGACDPGAPSGGPSMCTGTDAFPDDPNEQADTDVDGVGDNGDVCPATPAGLAVDAFGCADAQVDGDGDGICDPGAPSQGPSMCIGSDNCPADANADQTDFDSDGSGDACDADIDGDGVTNDADLCALTVADAPDRLGQNRWTLSNVASGAFDQAGPQAGTVFQFTTSNTGGCSCDEIVEITGAGKGHEKKGCSTSLMLEWIQTVP